MMCSEYTKCGNRGSTVQKVKSHVYLHKPCQTKGICFVKRNGQGALQRKGGY